jgi:hypothetical protein
LHSAPAPITVIYQRAAVRLLGLVVSVVLVAAAAVLAAGVCDARLIGRAFVGAGGLVIADDRLELGLWGTRSRVLDDLRLYVPALLIGT